MRVFNRVSDLYRIAVAAFLGPIEVSLRWDHQAGLSMVVWILKREVRAIGGCLGIHRR